MQPDHRDLMSLRHPQANYTATGAMELQVVPSPTETQRESGDTSGPQEEKPSDQPPVTTQEEPTDPPAASVAEPKLQTQSPARALPAQPRAEPPTESPRVIMTRSRTGTHIRASRTRGHKATQG